MCHADDSVDDLKEIGDLELYINQTVAINIFLSHWYFKSKNCLREVQSTVDKAKPLMLTHEVEVPKGGGPLEEIKIELDDPLHDLHELDVDNIEAHGLIEASYFS